MTYVAQEIGDRQGDALRRQLRAFARIADGVALGKEQFIGRQGIAVGGIADQAEAAGKVLDLDAAAVFLRGEPIKKLAQLLKAHTAQGILAEGNRLDDRLGARSNGRTALWQHPRAAAGVPEPARAPAPHRPRARRDAG